MLSNSSLFVFFLSVNNLTFWALFERHQEACCKASLVFSKFLLDHLCCFLGTLDPIHFFPPATFSCGSLIHYSGFFETLLYLGCLCSLLTWRLIINYSWEKKFIQSNSINQIIMIRTIKSEKRCFDIIWFFNNFLSEIVLF